MRRSDPAAFCLVSLLLLLVAAPRSAALERRPLEPQRPGSVATARAAVPAGFSEVVILGTNSVLVMRDASVTGDVVANDASAGPTLAPGFELAVDRNAAIQGNVSADSVELDRGVSVSGTVFSNELVAPRATVGGTSSPLSLPVFQPLPAFQGFVDRPGAEDIFVASGETRMLSQGSYGDIELAGGSTLVFGGGVFHVRSLNAVPIDDTTCPFPCRQIGFLGPSDVRIGGRFDSGARSFVGPVDASVAASDIILYIGGTNGLDGALGSLPPAAGVGRESVVEANLYAPFGTLLLERDTTATGAFLARDVQVDQANVLTADSFFANRPPTADPQTVFTAGAAPLVITLTGSDPENDDLVFSIATPPNEGTLSALTQAPPPSPGDPPGCAPADCVVPPDPPRTSAVVTYTPATADDLEDSFTFQVADPHGGTGMAVVRINPPGDPTPTPPPLDTVRALPATVEMPQDSMRTVVLRADAPNGVSLTFAITAGPQHGTLSALTQGGEVPQRTAAVTYTPEAGFNGSDSLDFEACGTIADTLVCDTATVTLNVAAPLPLAEDQTVSTAPDAEVPITLVVNPGGVGQSSGGVMILRALPAAFLDGAEIAGNVADADGDGAGDNHNDLPGSAPVLISAAVDSTGGAGSNGTVRIEIEWDLGSLGISAGDLESAQVLLNTVKGTTDSLDTFFFVGTGEQDGLLTDADFEAPAAVIPGVVMPVPDVAIGTEGTFSFDVTEELRAFLESDLAVFSIQGRVDEGLAGGGTSQRGLQVRSTASSNLTGNLEPQLAIATPGVTPEPTVSITVLPLHGTLLDSNGSPILAVPTTLATVQLTYVPESGFTGTDNFTYEVVSFSGSATGLVTVLVGVGDCLDDANACDDGRGN